MKRRRKSKIPVDNLTMRLAGQPGAKVHLYRWNPGPWMRNRGFKGVDLWTNGTAFTLKDCKSIGFNEVLGIDHRTPQAKPMEVSEAFKIGRQMNNLAQKTPAERQPRRITPRVRTFNDLCEEYLKAAAFRKCSPKTQIGYKHHLAHACYTFGAETPAAITAQLVTDWYEDRFENHGHNAALKDHEILRRVLNWGQKRDDWQGHLPQQAMYCDMRFEKSGGRLRIALPDELDALMLAFDDPHRVYAQLDTPKDDRILTPRPSLGDALTILLWTAARVNDGLSMVEGAWDGETIVYRPSKTRRKKKKNTLEIKTTGPLLARLPQMIKHKLAIFNGPSNHAEFVIDEIERMPYWRENKDGVRTHKHFNDAWRDYRDLAGKLQPSLIGEGVDRGGDPHLAFNAQDCRDTAVTRLVDAGCDLFEISAMHGSDPKEILSLVKHYIAIGPRHSTAAVEKLLAHAQKQGFSI